MDFTPLFIVGAATLRSVSGWLVNAISTSSPSGKKIDKFEWRQLVATIIRVGVLGAVIAYFPGLNLDAYEVAIVAFGTDYVMSALKKK